MTIELASQLENLDDVTFAACLDAAMVAATADGELSEDEVAELSDSIAEITAGLFEREQIMELLRDSLARFVEHGSDTLIDAIGEAIEDPVLRRVAFLMAAAAAWSRKGVETSEGLILQKLSRSLDIPEGEYFELLGQGKGLAQS